MKRMAAALSDAAEGILDCHSCRNFSSTEVCEICSDDKRDRQRLCVVESPADLIAMEATGAFHGIYFVLRGTVSPLDGRGPEELGLPLLKERVEREQIREVVMATNRTVEGEATAIYIADMLQSQDVRVSRLASGVPAGAELEYLDSTTIAQSLRSRTALDVK